MERRTHWLRQNAAARMPRRVVVFDTESVQERSVKGSTHSFRCGSGSFDLLDTEAQPTREPRLADWSTPEELWQAITEVTSNGHRTVAFAHNLAFDMRIARGFELLPALGFECRDLALSSYGFWADYSDGRRTLRLVDSLSFLPAALDRISTLVKLDKQQLPADDAEPEAWLARCRADVQITREAILRVLRFLKQEDCGDFRTTGAGQASACFRHRFLPARTLLVHDDVDALAAERRSAWTGRCEVWRHGEVLGRVYEYDFEYAYARLARRLQLPTRLIAEHGGIPYKRLERVMDHYAVVADVECKTDLPVVPTHSGSAIVWPTGCFDTTLWDYEMRALVDSGGTIRVHRYWFYHRAPLLQEWAAWIIGRLEAPPEEVDPVVRLMLKSWSRSLIGRFGLRYSSIEQIAQLPTANVRMFGCHDLDSGEQRTYVQLGKTLHERMEKLESPNSTPAVMAAVMSAARVQIWDAMNIAGLENVYYVDTDGLLVNAQGATRLDAAGKSDLLPGLRRKATYRSADIRAPRNLDLEETRRVAGAPKRAERLADNTYRGEVWESLPAALRNNRHGQVRTREQVFRISDRDPRRVHLPYCSTTALVLNPESYESAARSA